MLAVEQDLRRFNRNMDHVYITISGMNKDYSVLVFIIAAVQLRRFRP